MERFDFYELPRASQDRLRWSFRCQISPLPLIFWPGTRLVDMLWLGLSGASLLAMVALWNLGFGQLDAPLARHPLALVVLYVALCAAFFGGIYAAVAYQVRIRRLPFAPGIYLFEGRFIDAREGVLVTHAVSELTEVRGRRGELELQFGSRRYRLAVRPDRLERGIAWIEELRAAHAAGRDRASLSQIDPLVAPDFESPLAPHEAPVERPPPWTVRTGWAAAALGLIGVGLFFWRDARSDERLLAVAVGRDEVESYQRYLEVGSDPEDEVRRVYLPRAALREAAAEGTVEAIDAFRARYPDTEIEGEIAKSRRRALEATFARARSKSDLASLWAFDARYPGHHLSAELDAAEHALYRRAAEGIESAVAWKNARPLVKPLVEVLERLGPRPRGDGALAGAPVRVIVERVASRSLHLSDELVRNHPFYAGERSLPTQYFTRERLDPLERAAGAKLAEGFSRVFPEDVARFVVGGSSDESASPTLRLRYRIEPTGRNVATPKPRGVFAGLVVFGACELWLPGAEAPSLSTEHMFEQKVPIRMILDYESGDPPIEPALYASLIAGGFDALTARCLTLWFGEHG